MSLLKPGGRPGSWTTPKAAATPKLRAIIAAGPRTATASRTPASPWVESGSLLEDRVSLTMWHGGSDGAGATAITWSRNGEQRCDPGGAGRASAMASVGSYAMHKKDDELT